MSLVLPEQKSWVVEGIVVLDLPKSQKDRGLDAAHGGKN